MSISTGENEQGLRKIIDLTRGISMLLLFLHFYFYFGQVFREWGYATKITDWLMKNIEHTGLFNRFYSSKILALSFLLISLLGVKGRKDPNLSIRMGFFFFGIGFTIYFSSIFIFYIPVSRDVIAIGYILFTTIGFLCVLTGGV